MKTFDDRSGGLRWTWNYINIDLMDSPQSISVDPTKEMVSFLNKWQNIILITEYARTELLYISKIWKQQIE